MKKPDNLATYSDRQGYLAADGKIRIYGFSESPTEPQTEPVVAGSYPVEVEMKPGRYAWCSCGHSKMQPYCDNAHRDAQPPTNRKSYKFEVLEQCSVALCMCKKTKTPPFCDGSHEHCES